MNTPSKINTPINIVSLSLNPALDLTYQINELIHDQKSRATHTRIDPGGTGINVGRALQKLNAKSHTCCITAGLMGDVFSKLLESELDNVYTLKVQGETRINTTILQHSNQGQYEVNAAGSKITDSQLDEIIHHFLSLCGQGIGILTGSLPPNIANNTYKKINLALKKQGGHAIIDAPVAVLREALSSHPFLIKPNLHELEILKNKQLTSIEKIASEARSLVSNGTRNVCVSLGDKGAILTCEDNSYYCKPPRIIPDSTVGAGDSMVAGLAQAFSLNKTPEQALKLAVSCGTETAKQPGTQLFNLQNVETLRKRLHVKILDI